jgi:iron complex outermembrane receptor protein
LRGPQGTLFGKNSVGGAIQIVTVNPRPVNEAKVSAIVGSYDRVELRGVVNRVLSERVHARFSLGRITRDGYLKRRPPIYIAPTGPPPDSRAEGGESSLGGRLQLLWKADDRLIINLASDYARKRNTQAPKHIESINPATGPYPLVNPLIDAGVLPGPRLDSSILPASIFESLASGKNFSNLDNWALSATAERDVGFGTTKLILAYRELRTQMGQDDDGLYFGLQSTEFIDRQRQLTGELHVSGRHRGVEFTAGLFGLTDHTESFPASGIRQGEVLYTCLCFYTPLNRPAQISAHRILKSSSYAIYGQAMFDLADGLRATLGARYTYESKTVLGESITIDLDTLEPTSVVDATSGTQHGHWGAMTWRAGFDYRPTSDLLVYGSLSKGFKSGGFNARLTDGLPNLGMLPFAPETALTYELGLKSEWLDRRLRFNLTLFQSEYRDLQLRQLTIVGGILTRLVENAAAARIRGLEVELEARPLDRLQLRAAYGLISPRYLDVGQVPGITVDSEFQRTPRHSLSLFASYAIPLGESLLRLNADLRFRSKEQFQLVASPYDQPAFGLLGARLSYQVRERGWSIALFGTNLTGQRYRTASRDLTSIVGMPRQFGIEFQTEF